MASLTFRRIYVDDPDEPEFRVRDVTDQVLVDESNYEDFLEDSELNSYVEDSTGDYIS